MPSPRHNSWHHHHNHHSSPPPPHRHWHSLPPEPPTVPQYSSSSWILPFQILTLRRCSQCNDVSSCLFAYIIKFILEVLGAAGAIWGSSEVLMLRTSSNSVTVWRPMAAFVGSIFFLRWCVRVWKEINNRLRRRDDDEHSDDDEQSTSLAQSSSQDPDALYATLTEDLDEKKDDSIDDLEMIENV